MINQPQILKGLAELAVLSMLHDGPQYGVGILDRLRHEAGLNVSEGSIYPLLHRLARTGSVSAEWRLNGEQDRPRKYYSLTTAGRAELRTAVDEWLRTSNTLNAFVTRKTHK